MKEHVTQCGVWLNDVFLILFGAQRNKLYLALFTVLHRQYVEFILDSVFSQDLLAIESKN